MDSRLITQSLIPGGTKLHLEKMTVVMKSYPSPVIYGLKGDNRSYSTVSINSFQKFAKSFFLYKLQSYIPIDSQINSVPFTCTC